MPAKARPWWRRTRRRWYATVDGRQYPLDCSDPDNRQLAEELFRRLLETLQKPAATTPASPARTVRDAVSAFLERKQGKVSPECFRQYGITLTTHFLPHFGGRTFDSLTAEEIEDWADQPHGKKQQRWGNSTKNNNLGVVQTFLKWAGHPLAVRRPPKESRGAAAVLSEADVEKLVAAYDPRYGGDLPQLLRALHRTGARPSELTTLTAAAVDWDNACTRLAKHKTARHGHARVIHFPAAALAILEAQRDKYGDGGHLFRTRNGKPYVMKYWVQQMGRLSRRSGVRGFLYTGRHSFATLALVAGVPDATVAALLGHKSTAMIVRSYGHVSGQAKALKAAAELATKPQAG